MHSYAVGNRVTHEQYGDGTITRADQYHTQIAFDAHGIRTFITTRVELTTASTPAPAKASARRRKAKTA